jgi:molybdopterin-biosynthesis enzyme MoeA-like protein
MRENFYALIIGTEILNGRREDRHFKFLRDTFKDRGFKFAGSFTIDDNLELIASTISYISNLPNSVLFSFGGIGSTPDDYTRLAASKALRDGTLHIHKDFEKIILDRLGEKAYPHPINMAKLPSGAKLLPNPINRMPGFYLDDRFFFMPGFPEMSHPMVEYILDNIFSGKGAKEYRYTLTALCRENEFIELMKSAPKDVEVSSLPKLYTDGWRTTISIASLDDNKAKSEFDRYKEYLENRGINYAIGEE